MAEQPKMTVSARIDPAVADRLDELARVQGVTRSVVIERLLSRTAGTFMTFNGEHGSVAMRLIGRFNTTGLDRASNADHPAIELWECEEPVWPRHFIHVFAEFGAHGEGSSEMWLLWRGDEVEAITPDAWMLKAKKKGATK